MSFLKTNLGSRFQVPQRIGLLEVEKETEGIALLKELTDEGFAPAVHNLLNI